MHHAQIPLSGILLEIGGGVSGHALLLTDVAERVICTDLLEVGSSYGGKFAEAARLRHSVTSGRLEYVCGRGEALPLRDGCVDTVFSSFVLEHIGTRSAAVAEIRRVLRPGGYVITNVPNRLEQVYRALGFYPTTVPKQLVKSALNWTGLDRRLRVRMAVLPAPRPRTIAEARRWIRSTFTYPPHGDYPDHWEEFVASGISRWDRLFEQHGLRICRRFTVTLEKHFSLLNSRLTMRMQHLLLPFVRRYGDSPAAVIAGVSYCFVARKPPLAD